MRIRMLVHLSGNEESTMLPGEEYEVAAHVAARYYDHGIADIVEPGWEARPRLGTDEERRDRGETPIDYRPWDDVIASLNPVATFRFDVPDEGLALKPGQTAETPAADAGMTTESAAPAVPAEKPKRARSARK